jgi:ankyrin repeat protein
MSPLDYAVKNDHYEAAEYLLNQGATLTFTNDGDSDADTLLFAAGLNGGNRMVRLICGSGYNIPKKSYSAAIRGAIESGNNEALVYLLDQSKLSGYPLETEALIAACGKDSDVGNSGLDAVKISAKRGANLNGSNKAESAAYGEPLSDASRNGDAEIVKYLIDQGADVNAYSTYREESPLEVAADYGYFDIVKVLITNGARIDENFDWDWYRDTGSQRIYSYLKSAAKMGS